MLGSIHLDVPWPTYQALLKDTQYVRFEHVSEDRHRRWHLHWPLCSNSASFNACLYEPLRSLQCVRAGSDCSSCLPPVLVPRSHSIFSSQVMPAFLRGVGLWGMLPEASDIRAGRGGSEEAPSCPQPVLLRKGVVVHRRRPQRTPSPSHEAGCYASDAPRMHGLEIRGHAV